MTLISNRESHTKTASMILYPKRKLHGTTLTFQKHADCRSRGRHNARHSGRARHLHAWPCQSLIFDICEGAYAANLASSGVTSCLGQIAVWISIAFDIDISYRFLGVLGVSNLVFFFFHPCRIFVGIVLCSLAQSKCRWQDHNVMSPCGAVPQMSILASPCAAVTSVNGRLTQEKLKLDDDRPSVPTLDLTSSPVRAYSAYTQ